MTVERPALDAVQRLQDRIAQEAKDKKASSKAAQASAQGISKQALVMRERRARPDIAAKERKAIKARDAAMRKLAKAHPDEFLVYEQEERARLGLPVLVPRKRGTKASPTPPTEPHSAAKKPVRRTPPPPAALVPPPPEVRAQCRHNQGLTKTGYGTFCAECGHKIR